MLSTRPSPLFSIDRMNMQCVIVMQLYLLQTLGILEFNQLLLRFVLHSFFYDDNVLSPHSSTDLLIFSHVRKKFNE